MTNPPFIPFGQAHLLALGLILFALALLPWLAHKFLPAYGRRIGLAIAVLLFLNEVVIFLLDIFVFDLRVALSLPLQLCSMAALLTAWMLWRQSYAAYEVAWFWGIGGSLVAILTPDLSVGFPHHVFFHFFIGHGMIMLGVMHATFACGFRPVLRSVGKAILASIMAMLAVGLINHMLGTNYMYLCTKPAQATLMDHMGPWPWYLGSLVVAGSFVYLLCYLPFVFIRKRSSTVC